MHADLISHPRLNFQVLNPEFIDIQKLRVCQLSIHSDNSFLFYSADKQTYKQTYNCKHTYRQTHHIVEKLCNNCLKPIRPTYLFLHNLPKWTQIRLAAHRLQFYSFFTARCTLVQSAVLRSHVVRLSV